METKKKRTHILGYMLPSLGSALWMAAFFGVLLVGRIMMNKDGDLGRHLTIGGYILDSSSIPLQDRFSHTMTGEPLTPHEWLAQVLFAFAERLLGFNGVILVCALLIAGTFLVLYRQVRGERRTLLPVVLAVLLAMITSTIHWLSRPHLFTFLLLALWVGTLYQLRRGELRRWWQLPALMLLWANLHGAYIAGFTVWFIYGFGVAWDLIWHKAQLPKGFWRAYGLGGLSALAVTLINPSGLDLWRTSIGYLGTSLVDYTMEYKSPDFHNLSGMIFLFFIVLLVVVLGLYKKRMRAPLLFNAAAWLAMGLYSARNIPLFAIIAAPLLAQGLEFLLLDAAPRSALIRRIKDADTRILGVDQKLKGWVWPALSVVIALVGFAAGVNFSYDRQPYGFKPEVFPVEAVNWLKDNPQEGEVFNLFIWGGYLLHSQWPDALVFIDGQTDFYGEALTGEYASVLQLKPGWEDVLDKYDVGYVLLPPNEIAIHFIQNELGWEAVYQDDTAIILQRP